ncbi:SDR family oxidoreductase [Bythopirellula polymerisocia]|uniref:UDP-glucose 4-epimerase n=1 Tax=Bythopirellula polymerisocia TaxID=2528003 RepID=A0A5C6C8I4_9BACT|nr:SDR family oxidoreductase [Bythopirellula polymerisocia]TWU20860.1 UDP-glucose 4-epimerase [Bythopirellula polymerisocia]
MKVLVTGGAGFIGSHITSALVERGDKVRVLDNLCAGKRENLTHLGDAVELIEGDVADPRATAAAVEGMDLIFHQAALASVPRSVTAPLDTNAACVTGTVTLLDAARKSGVRRLVYAGSSSAYGNTPQPAKTEQDLPAPLSPYAAAKLAAEYYCQAFTETFGLETVTIRYFNVFGPRQDPTSEYSAVIPIFVSLMLQGKRPTIYGDGLQSRDFTYVADIVRGNLLAAESQAAVGKSINVATGKQFTLLDLVAAINRVLGTAIEPIFADPRPGDVRESLADTTLAQKLLKFESQISFDEGLELSIDYYRSLNRSIS